MLICTSHCSHAATLSHSTGENELIAQSSFNNYSAPNTTNHLLPRGRSNTKLNNCRYEEILKQRQGVFEDVCVLHLQSRFQLQLSFRHGRCHVYFLSAPTFTCGTSNETESSMNAVIVTVLGLSLRQTLTQTLTLDMNHDPRPGLVTYRCCRVPASLSKSLHRVVISRLSNVFPTTGCCRRAFSRTGSREDSSASGPTLCVSIWQTRERSHLQHVSC